VSCAFTFPDNCAGVTVVTSRNNGAAEGHGHNQGVRQIRIRHRYRIRRDWHLYADAFAQGRSLGGHRCREQHANTEADQSAHRKTPLSV
jgi:hypothetical protein